MMVLSMLAEGGTIGHVGLEDGVVNADKGILVGKR